MIQYEITRMDLDAHEFHVRMTVQRNAPGPLTLRLPAWIPGSYMIRDFARHITEIAASDAAGDVPVVKRDKQTWEVASTRDEVVVVYRVYAFDLSVRACYLDRFRAYFNGTGMFLAVDGARDADWQLVIERPRDAGAAGWSVATTLPAQGVDGDGFGRYAGHGIARLYDCPVEIGVFRRLAFSVDGVPHAMVVSDGGAFDESRVTADLAPICAEHGAMFGELPVDQYLFLTLASADGYGGLEHADSTSLICKRSDLPRVGLDRPDNGYRQFLALCSHEYFHLWNVKRIRPAVLADADLSREVHTELLWAFEGITSYYDELALVRSGVLDGDEYLDLLAGTVTRVMRGAGRARQSIAASSFDAWTKFYKQEENAPNAIVSYYAKGALVAFGLDITLRQLSDDRVSLDDLMRALWQRHGRSAVGVPERGIERVAADLVDAPLDDFFASYVYGTVELPLTAWFAAVGVGVRLRAPRAADDVGGQRRDPPPQPAAPALGARFTAQPDGLRITHVLAGGAAQSAGLCAGDQLIAIAGERVDGGNVAAVLGRVAGDAVDVHYFRRGRLVAAALPLRPAADDTCDLWQLTADESTPQALARRAAWWRSRRAQDH
ncbi:MAG: PDZ domain-containing protein [Gammaproteobacteria bacterium]|nr:PDZ domain-containing protein [Gammaproteobacteria bacterium]